MFKWSKIMSKWSKNMKKYPFYTKNIYINFTVIFLWNNSFIFPAIANNVTDITFMAIIFDE